MKRTALFASIALAAGLAAPAFAQEIAGTTVSAEDWPYVEEYCDSLADMAQVDSVDATTNPSAELATTTIELSTLTREDCQAAGLIDEGPAGTLPTGNEGAEDSSDSSAPN